MATIASNVGGLTFGVRTDRQRTAGRIRALLGDLVRPDGEIVGSNFSVTTPRLWGARPGALYEGGTEVLRSRRLRPLLAALASRVSSLQAPAPPAIAADLRAIACSAGVVLVDARNGDLPWTKLGDEWSALDLRHVHVDQERRTVVVPDGIPSIEWAVVGGRPPRSERPLLGIVTTVNDDSTPALLDVWARASRPRDGWYGCLVELHAEGRVIGARSRGDIADAARRLAALGASVHSAADGS